MWKAKNSFLKNYTGDFFQTFQKFQNANIM